MPSLLRVFYGFDQNNFHNLVLDYDLFIGYLNYLKVVYKLGGMLQ